MKVLPNSPVTIAREVQMNLDLRSPDWETLNEGYAAVRDIVSKAELEAKVKIELTPTHEWKLSPYQPEGVHLADAVATELGLKHEQVQTVAGHDSTNMKDTCPTVMLFIPSVDGISHNEAEFTKDEDMEDGVRMMTATLTELCQGALNA